jgi:hypothetical protein
VEVPLHDVIFPSGYGGGAGGPAIDSHGTRGGAPTENAKLHARLIASDVSPDLSACGAGAELQAEKTTADKEQAVAMAIFKNTDNSPSCAGALCAVPL